MTALISATSLPSGSGRRPIRFFGRSRMRSIRLERETPITSATVVIGMSFGGDGGSRSCFFDPVACSSASLRISASSVFLPSSRQRPLHHKPAPGEQLVWGNAMPTSHQAYRHTRLEGLFDHANLLRGRPAPTTLNRRDDF